MADYFKGLTQNLWTGLRVYLWVKILAWQLLNIKQSATHSYVKFDDTFLPTVKLKKQIRECKALYGTPLLLETQKKNIIYITWKKNIICFYSSYIITI